MPRRPRIRPTIDPELVARVLSVMRAKADKRGRYRFDWATLAWHVREQWPDFERPRIGQLDIVIEHLQATGQIAMRQTLHSGLVAVLCEAKENDQ